jgi:hypothetical protein
MGAERRERSSLLAGVESLDPSPEKASLLSLAVPGLGQYVQGKSRWIAYAAAEIAGWLLVLDRRNDGERLRAAYRDLAWTTAREPLGPGPRLQGDFDYYETVASWTRSGRWDRDASADGLQPEVDPATYNGAVWALARDLFLPSEDADADPDDPGYQRALDYYRQEAYSPEFLWDWSARPGERSRYSGLIRESDDRFRDATLLTGAVVVNHILSAVDAFVSARLAEASGMEVATTIRMHTPPPLISGLILRPTLLLTIRP